MVEKKGMNLTSCTTYAPHVLRYGMVFVFLYFGISQILAPADWTAWLPVWTESLPVSQVTFVLLNGWFEAIFGTLLLLGIWTRIVAGLLALHLLAITFDIGYTEIGVRDFGLTIAALVIAMNGDDSWCLSRKWNKK